MVANCVIVSNGPPGRWRLRGSMHSPCTDRRGQRCTTLIMKPAVQAEDQAERSVTREMADGWRRLAEKYWRAKWPDSARMITGARGSIAATPTGRANGKE